MTTQRELIGLLDSVALSHFRSSPRSVESLREMVRSGEIKDITDIAFSLIRIDRPDAALEVLRSNEAQIGNIDRTDRLGYTMLALAAECRLCAMHKTVHESLIAFLIRRHASIEKAQMMLRRRLGEDGDLSELSKKTALAHA